MYMNFYEILGSLHYDELCPVIIYMHRIRSTDKLVSILLAFISVAQYRYVKTPAVK